MLLPINLTLDPNSTTRIRVTLEHASQQTEYVVIAYGADSLYCIESICPHSGGPLSRGTVGTLSSSSSSDIEDLNVFVTCPWHSFRFSLTDGSCDHTAAGGHAAKTLKAERDSITGSVNLHVPENTSLVSYAEFEFTDACSAKPKPTIVTPAEDVPQLEDGKSWPLVDWCIRVLNEPNPALKVKLTAHVFNLWNDGTITDIGSGTPPDEPARDSSLSIVQPIKTKRIKKGGSLASRIAILHSLASIEQWAIDLAMDVMARFANVTVAGERLPREFFTDFLKVANDEAKHFRYLIERLEALGSYYGALSIHAALWESAQDTRGDILSRLAIVHMVHEARGLDVNPQTIARFETAGDADSVVYLTEIHNDEMTHVHVGQRWFKWACDLEGKERYSTFHALVRTHFKGPLKPPINHEDRARAGLEAEYYMPFSSAQ
ncbi:hypothetical protein HDU77_009012 [Chytriomyces hyalinus]|nr:hypothetical protein HDU77_009012 [Chytriomyces hyalinus]